VARSVSPLAVRSSRVARAIGGDRSADGRPHAEGEGGDAGSDMSEGRLYIFTGPTVSLIVAIVFLLVWLYQKERRHVLYFAAAFVAYAAAALSQILQIPPDIGQNTMVSAIIYTFSIFCLVEGVLARFEKSGAGPLLFSVAGCILLLLYYFFYFDRNLVARIYVQNFGYGLIFLVAAAQIGVIRRRPWREQVLFWTIVLFGLHFFVRTILTMRVSSRIYELDQMRQAGADTQALAAAFRESPFWQVLNFTMLVSAFAVAIILLATIALDVIEDLKRQGAVDPLTGLANRRGFDQLAAERMADRSLAPFCVVYCDLDHFKSINDTYGHLAGDRVLQAFGKLLAAEVGHHDVAARLGGEEFVVLLARSNKAGASLFAERVRAEMDITRFTALPLHVNVTASFGVAEGRPEEDMLELLQRADAMVYAAKAAGRNCVIVERDGGA